MNPEIPAGIHRMRRPEILHTRVLVPSSPAVTFSQRKLPPVSSEKIQKLPGQSRFLPTSEPPSLVKRSRTMQRSQA